MSRESTLEQDHCNEIVMLPGSLFEFTSRYVSAERYQQLLALYALIRSIASIPTANTEDSVKWAKLKWWGEELLAEPESPSRHPVLRALWHSGARQQLDNGLLLRLVSSAVGQIDVAPDANKAALYERLANNGETGILLELALDGAKIASQKLVSLAAASGLYEMISSFADHRQTENFSVPLDLLAKYQLTAPQLKQQPAVGEVTDVISHLANTGTEWFLGGISELAAIDSMHLRLRFAMEERILVRLRKNAAEYLNEGKRFGPADAWFAWRICRRGV